MSLFFKKHCCQHDVDLDPLHILWPYVRSAKGAMWGPLFLIYFLSKTHTQYKSMITREDNFSFFLMICAPFFFCSTPSDSIISSFHWRPDADCCRVLAGPKRAQSGPLFASFPSNVEQLIVRASFYLGTIVSLCIKSFFGGFMAGNTSYAIPTNHFRSCV